jgi:cytochrome b6-f complex iron-sulfur subunit
VHAPGLHTKLLPAENKFKCRCHGSGYYKSEVNFEGPAPRPLDRFQITVAGDGQLVADKNVTYKMQPGVEPDEQYPQSVLKA